MMGVNGWMVALMADISIDYSKQKITPRMQDSFIKTKNIRS